MSDARNSLRLVLLLLALIASAVPAQAQQYAENLGPLKVELAEGATWTAAMRSGWMLLSNRTNTGSYKLYYTSGAVVSTGTRSIKTNLLVRGAGTRASYAGLVFSRRAGNNFLAFLIRNDGAAFWMQQSPDRTDFNPVAGATARMDGTDVLELREAGGKMQMLLNGKIVQTVQSRQGFTPSFGIAAIGTGRFGFDAFAVTETGLPAAPERPETDPEPLTEEQLYRRNVLLGTTLGIWFHEMGHAVIGEAKLPATGPEEDVADGFAAFILSNMVRTADTPEKAKRMAEIARQKALLWFHSAKYKETAGVEGNWQGEHSPDIRRFRNTLCVLYGGSPVVFDDLASRFELTARTRQRCQESYRKRYDAWEQIMSLVSRNLGSDLPGKFPADEPGGKIIVTFETPTSPLANEVVALVDGPDKIVRGLAGFLERAIVWPRDFQVTFKHCNEMNAWYDPNTHSVTMCYEAIEGYSGLVFEGERQAAERQ